MRPTHLLFNDLRPRFSPFALGNQLVLTGSDEWLPPNAALPDPTKASSRMIQRTLVIAIPFLAKSSPGCYDESQVEAAFVPRESPSVGKGDLMGVKRAFNDSPLYSQAHPNLRDRMYVRKDPRLAGNIRTLGVGRTGHLTLEMGRQTDHVQGPRNGVAAPSPTLLG